MQGFSINAFEIPIAVIGDTALFVEWQTKDSTTARIEARITFAEPSMPVFTALQPVLGKIHKMGLVSEQVHEKHS